MTNINYPKDNLQLYVGPYEEFPPITPPISQIKVGEMGIRYLVLEESGKKGYLVTEEQRKRWGVSLAQLHRDAAHTTKQRNGHSLSPIGDVLRSLQPEEELGDEMDPNVFYVLSNESTVRGACVLFYDGMLEDMANQLGGDYYILPSSVHEVLLLPQESGIDPKHLQGMVQEINGNPDTIDPKDVLANHVYQYSQKEKTLYLLNVMPSENDPEICTIQREVVW